jgi:hypothetical protein
MGFGAGRDKQTGAPFLLGGFLQHQGRAGGQTENRFVAVLLEEGGAAGEGLQFLHHALERIRQDEE